MQQHLHACFLVADVGDGSRKELGDDLQRGKAHTSLIGFEP